MIENLTYYYLHNFLNSAVLPNTYLVHYSKLQADSYLNWAMVEFQLALAS